MKVKKAVSGGGPLAPLMASHSRGAPWLAIRGTLVASHSAPPTIHHPPSSSRHDGSPDHNIILVIMVIRSGSFISATHAVIDSPLIQVLYHGVSCSCTRLVGRLRHPSRGGAWCIPWGGVRAPCGGGIRHHAAAPAAALGRLLVSWTRGHAIAQGFRGGAGHRERERDPRYRYVCQTFNIQLCKIAGRIIPS